MEKILVTSGRGGAGKSVICALLAVTLARRYEKKVLLIEGGTRSIDLLLGVGENVVYDMGDLARERCRTADALLTIPNLFGVALLAASLDGCPLDKRTFERACASGECYDYVLIEVDGRDMATLEAAAAVCTQALLICAPDPVSARENRLVADRLADWGISQPRLCINQLPKDFLRSRPVPDLDYMIDTVCARLIGVIPWDFTLINLQGATQMTKLSKKVGIIFDNLAQRIMGKDIDLLVQ